MRYDIFNIIHKGLRASLYHTAIQLQQTDFTSSIESEDAVNRIKEIVMLFDGHARKEDEFILPALAAYEPSVVVAFEDEHAEDLKLGQELNHCIDTLENSQSDLEKIIAGRLLSKAFVGFMVFNLEHMAKEEDILNKLLWRYYSDDEIKLIGTRIGSSVEPWIQDFYATWILRGLNQIETLAWIRAIKNGMPAIVYQTILQKAEKELPAHRYRKLGIELNKQLQVA
jgi:hypothetical protein